MSLDEARNHVEPCRRLRRSVDSTRELFVSLARRRILDLVPRRLAKRNLNNLDWLISSKEESYLTRISNCGREPDTLKRGPCYFSEPLKTNCELCPSPVPSELVDLVDDHGFDVSQVSSHPAPRQYCLQSFRGRNEQIGRSR